MPLASRPPRYDLRPEWIPKTQRILTGALVAIGVLLVAGWTQKGSLVSSEDIAPALLQEPVQEATDRRPFTFGYAGETFNVEPVADYELWGLVVTHNDVEGFGDIYHDESSVDTKDLCVIWGRNLQTDDFRRVDFDSGSFTCYFRYPGGVRFDPSALSNSHLITDNQAIRDRIAEVRVGDQIHFRGSLVNYQAASHPQFWRRTSTTRADAGAGACEVVFVDQLDILRRGTPGWYTVYSAAWWLVVMVVAAKAGVFVWEARRRYV